MVDILLVEDNKELSSLMSKFFVRDGYSVYCAKSGEEAIEFFNNEIAKLVILDIMLPKIIISAMVDKEDKMNGFNLGADDYIEKPIDIDILNAKISSLFKRLYEKKENPLIIKSGEIEINQDSMEVTFKGNKLNLTIKEYDLLLLLIENKGKTLSKEYIFNRIWGKESESENQTLTVHIKMLRDKIEEDSKNPTKIKTVWGVGYRYEEI